MLSQLWNWLAFDFTEPPFTNLLLSHKIDSKLRTGNFLVHVWLVVAPCRNNHGVWGFPFSRSLSWAWQKLQKKVPLGPVKPSDLAMNSQSPPRLSQNSEMLYFALDGLLASQLEECHLKWVYWRNKHLWLWYSFWQFRNNSWSSLGQFAIPLMSKWAAGLDLLFL